MFNIGQKQLPSVMQHSFSKVPRANIPRSQFKQNYEYKSTFNANWLVPMYWAEVYPGDTANDRFSAICRMITPETPFMDNLYLDMFFFFIPNRIIHDDWEKLMGEQDNPGDSIDFATPKITAPATTGFVPPSDIESSPTDAQLAAALYDYLGYPTRVADYEAHNYLARSYNLIYNEWFRDQNLQDSVVVDKDAGPDTVTDYKLLKRGKRHDYFTSCLPWLQKGVAENLPIGTSAPITSDVALSTDVTVYSTNFSDWRHLKADSTAVELYTTTGTSGEQLYADLTSGTSATIGQLYESFAIQDLLQTDARGGTRYVELINAHFGVTSPDFRLQRPEYLGGSSDPFMVSPLAQTSETNTSELGTLAATATASIDGIGYLKSFVEHGWVLGLMNVRADLTYQQGLHRSLSRDTRYDFYFPALANLGEQEVYNKEIYVQGTSADDNVFGYQERWAEMRYGRSVITGKMRSNDPQSLDVWHLSQEFDSLPSLNAAFIEEDTPIDRVTAVTSEPHFKIDIYGRCTWTRPLPMYSVPGLMNRF